MEKLHPKKEVDNRQCFITSSCLVEGLGASVVIVLKKVNLYCENADTVIGHMMIQR